LFAEGGDPGLREMLYISLMVAALMSFEKASNMCLTRASRTQTDDSVGAVRSGSYRHDHVACGTSGTQGIKGIERASRVQGQQKSIIWANPVDVLLSTKLTTVSRNRTGR